MPSTPERPEPTEYPAIDLFALSERIYRVYIAAGSILEPRTLSPNVTSQVQLAIGALIAARLHLQMALRLPPYLNRGDEQPTPPEPSLDVLTVRDRIHDLYANADVNFEEGVPPDTLGHAHLALNALWMARSHIDVAARLP